MASTRTEERVGTIITVLIVKFSVITEEKLLGTMICKN